MTCGKTTRVLLFFLFSLCQPINAQNLQTLYAFVSTNGCNPQAPLTEGTDGNFYGTTPTGGTNGGYGTIFQVTTNGILSSLFQFSLTNGAYPYAGLISANDGSFYGTTEYGGSFGKGTLFKITTNGLFSLLFSFNGTNGANPTASLTQGSDGTLYGTTTFGGTNGFGYGGVFKLKTDGVFTNLGFFTSANGFTSTHVANPISGLVFGTDGRLYGMTAYGGTYGYGTAFRVATNGSLTFLNSFNNNYGANYCSSLCLGVDGFFYGTTQYGSDGYGTVFKMNSSGTLSWSYSLRETTGSNPLGNLVAGNDGAFYGTTSTGNTNGGFGTVFRVTSNGVLSFPALLANTNGAYPYAGLVFGSDGNFYGTAFGGGDTGQGAIFQMTTNWIFTELASFTGSIGYWPKAGLTVGSDGNFYGTTSSGGTNGGYGTFFQITTNGIFISLASFALTNGVAPSSDLILGSDGNIYGTTQGGSSGGRGTGTVFKIMTNLEIQPFADFPFTGFAAPYSTFVQGNDGSFYGTSDNGGAGNSYGSIFKVTMDGLITNIFLFAYTNGANPKGGLCIGKDGAFYGTTHSGNAEGTVFRISTNGVLTTLKTFPATASGDGALPCAGLCLANDGNLYGTTSSGGGITNSIFTFGCGQAFKIATNGVVSAVASFGGSNGIQPQAELVAGSDGNLYGTTMFGGTGGSSSAGMGTIFRLKPKGGISALVSFNRANGTYLPFAGTVSTSPQATLVIGNDGNIYGTTTYGGIGGNGTIFRLSLPPDLVSPPKNQTNVIGSTASFMVLATSLQPLKYQWQKDGINLTNSVKFTGTDSTNLSINEVLESDAGTYAVVVMNSNFSITNQADLLIFVPPLNFNASITNANQLSLQLLGTTNHSYILQTTTNLTPPVIWKSVFTNPADVNGNWQFIDTNLNGSQKFYRAVGQ
jgi:uncharacterized repeat protein (TIGR03803 family)